MSYEFKRLGEVIAAEAVTDETNVLIEENGVIKKTMRKNIGSVQRVNGFEPNEMGNVDFPYVKSVNGFEPDGAGNVAMEIPASFSQVTYYVNPHGNPYLYADSGLTTPVTYADIASLLAEGKSMFTIKDEDNPYPHAMYPIYIGQMGPDYIGVTLFDDGEFVYFYTAEYEAEEPVGPPV